MRILIAPNFANPYDQRMVNGLATGFMALGHESLPLSAPLPPRAMVDLAKRLTADVVMQVNRFRPVDPPLPSNIRHIAWFQDVFPDIVYHEHEGTRENDLVYALGDAGVLGLKIELPCFVGCLLTGVDPAHTRLGKRTAKQAPDFSLCGYIPPPSNIAPNINADLVWYVNDLIDRTPVLGRSWSFRQARARILRRILPYGYVPFALANSLRATTEALYRPLQGNLDILLLSSAMYAEASEFARDRTKASDRKNHWSRRGRLGRILAPYRTTSLATNGALDNFVNHMAREHPRLLDRTALVRAALRVSKSVELFGQGWDKHPEFESYYKGMKVDPTALLPIFRRSRINLANNTHGLGLHSRTLECMAVGGFIFMHKSPNDEKPGGMLTAFEPAMHYGEYTLESFEEDAKRWLKDEEARIQAGARAAVAVREGHLWTHRAQQIVEDLKR